MESCEPNNGRAYVVFREEKNVNELGNNVPSLVPYDCSSEEEEATHHDLKSNVEGLWSSNSELPKSDSSGKSNKSIIKSLPPEQYFVDPASDDELRFYTEDDSDEDDVPRSPEVCNIYTTDKTFDVSFCMDILKANGCSESSFLSQLDIVPGYFSAKLHKEEVEKAIVEFSEFGHITTCAVASPDRSKASWILELVIVCLLVDISLCEAAYAAYESIAS